MRKADEDGERERRGQKTGVKEEDWVGCRKLRA